MRSRYGEIVDYYIYIMRSLRCSGTFLSVFDAEEVPAPVLLCRRKEATALGFSVVGDCGGSGAECRVVRRMWLQR
jgi:hypothetical protein